MNCTPRQVVLFRGASVEDAVTSRPGGALLVERSEGVGRLLAAGAWEEVRRHPGAAGAGLVDRPRSVLIPGLVNAHTHLDLTHVGPRPHDPGAGFVGFAVLVGRERHTEADRIGESVRRGVGLALAGGTVAVGDIAGCPRGRLTLRPLEELRASPLLGVSFLEFFGIGKGEADGSRRLGEWLETVEWGRREGVSAGLQPHAPYSVSARLYRAAAEAGAARGIPLATHLAEHPEEREFVTRGRGPARQFLERLGLWDGSVLHEAGHGQSPVRHVEAALERARFLLAHVNDAGDEDIALLARAGASVAYCPRASESFGNHLHFGPHRYRDMLAAGVNVALGTDSLISLPVGAEGGGGGGGGGGPGLSVLDEARRLFRRDGTPARTLLAMATVNGARALGLDPEAFEFRPGHPVAGVVAVEVEGESRERPLEGALRGDGRVELLLTGKAGAPGTWG